MPAYQLVPACKDYIWGGQRLKDILHIASGPSPLAEAWVLSCHPDGPSILQDGGYAGLTLPEYLRRAGRDVLGENCARFERFPMLLKFIDAKRDLSLQVHPTDEYALAHEGQYGKAELLVVLDAEPGAFLYYGFEREVTRDEFARRIGNNTLTEVLRRLPVKKGDSVFIPAGTLHAICAGVLLVEIQQNSNVTYRVSDYGRLGPGGKPRPLHVEKALEAASLRPAVNQDFGSHLGSCPYFTTDGWQGSFSAECGGDSFHALLVAGGRGTLRCGGRERNIQMGDCFFLPAGSGVYQVEGDCRVLVSYVSK